MVLYNTQYLSLLIYQATGGMHVHTIWNNLEFIKLEIILLDNLNHQPSPPKKKHDSNGSD